MVLAHNHPSGRTVPSQADLAFTQRLLDAGDLLGIQVVDHLILVRRSWRSLRESTRLWDHLPSRVVQPIATVFDDP